MCDFQLYFHYTGYVLVIIFFYNSKNFRVSCNEFLDHNGNFTILHLSFFIIVIISNCNYSCNQTYLLSKNLL